MAALHLPMRPLLIGIAGCSGSGKSTLAQAIAAASGEGAVVLPMDSYYRDLSRLTPAERARVNFDHPSALDWPLFLDHLEKIGADRAIKRPRYDFSRHVRCAETDLVPPRPLVIVEGILALFQPEVRELYQTAVFVETGLALCLERRVARDAAERGRTPESVVEQFHASVRPMYEQFVLPTKRHASVVADGSQPFDGAVAKILSAWREAGQELAPAP